MKKITAITTFINEISYLLDKGQAYSIEETRQYIESGNLLEQLQSNFSLGSDTPLDLTHYHTEDRDYINLEYQNFLQGYWGSEKSKWGIENNGLCLLVSWGASIIRNIEDYNERC